MRSLLLTLALAACTAPTTSDKDTGDTGSGETDTDTDPSGGDSGDTGDTGATVNVLEPGQFDPPFETTHTTLDVATTTGPRSVVTLVPDGTKTVGGKTLPVVKMLDELGDPGGMTLVASFEGPRFVLGSVTIEQALGGLDITIEGGTPIEMDLTTPVGAKQSLSVDGTVTIGTPGVDDPGYLPFTFEYTVTDREAVAPAPMGDVPGCRHTTFSTSSGPLSVGGELWTRDDIGFVHAAITEGTWGALDGGASGYVGWQDDGDVAAIQSERRLTPTGDSFVLSTYEVNEADEADKDENAQLYLEVRWADADRAKTDEAPPVTVTMGTELTTFDTELVKSAAGFLHPEVADEGYRWWIVAVDDDASDETENGVSYYARVDHTGGVEGDDLIVGAFLKYAKVSE